MSAISYGVSTEQGLAKTLGYHWNPSTLSYEVNTGGTTTGTDVNVTNFPSSYPITASSLPLPTGAATETTLQSVAGFNVPAHDYASLNRDGNGILTSMTFKTGGSGGSTVATITFARNGNNQITGITKT